MKAILKKLNIDETLTKTKSTKYKKKEFTNVKSILPKEPYWNYAMDLLILPKTKELYIGLLVVVDLATNKFDIEPIKNKSSEHVLDAFLKLTKRKYLKVPKYTLRSDAGNEFQGKFQKYLYNESIYHSVTLPGKHSQNANVERLNKELGRLIMGYLNSKENETKRTYRDWTPILKTIREDLNEFRDITDELPKEGIFAYDKDLFDYSEDTTKSKFKVGDMVHKREYEAKNIHDKKEYGESKRMGDFRYSKLTYKITHIYLYPKPVTHRYQLNNIPNATFTDFELLKSTIREQTFYIKSILDKMYDRKTKTHYYKIWWKGELKSKATWEPIKELEKDANIKEYVEEYENKKKLKK